MAAGASSVEEDLRYYSCIGHEEGVKELIDLHVDLNSRNSMNGWTALHWAASRNHPKIIQILLQNGANPVITNCKGETPANLTTNSSIREMLGENSDMETTIPQLPIIPSYLKYPPLPVIHSNMKNGQFNEINIMDSKGTKNELILKVRTADAEDPDFIEIELGKLTIDNLVDVCCNELQLEKRDIVKIRKLPNTLIRKDKDVERLKNYQEIEIVVNNEH